MENNQDYRPDIEKKYRPLVVILSIVIPLVVALLFRVHIEGIDTSFLPPIYASINALTAILLVFAVISIKNGNKKRHENLMKLAILCSLLFLVGYVIYHMTSSHTSYGNDGFVKYIYLFLLVTHIILSIAIIPLVMITYLKAISNNFKAHRRLAKITFPIWLYVAVSGVVVYLMISPFYGT